MGEIGTATVKVLPDLEEFKAIMSALDGAGFTVCEVVEIEYNASGQQHRVTTTKTVTKN